MLDRLIEAVGAGESRALVVRGEPGVGKTALLEYLVEQAPGFRVVRAAGVQSEMELAFAGLHQLLAPMLDRLEGLPAPQSEALRTVFGLSSGRAPDRFFLGLAVLSLLSEVAEEQPLLCVVDDEQWLDRASADVLAFVARRLDRESVGLIFAARAVSDELAGLPELGVGGLSDVDADALLDSLLTAPLDPRVREQIVSETRGIPLAMLEVLRDCDSGRARGRLRARPRRSRLQQHRGDLPAPGRRASVRFAAARAARGGRSRRRSAARLARGRAAGCLD